MQETINSTRTIKSANSCLVLDILRKNDRMTIEEIVRTAHLSRPTVLSIIEDMMQRSVIRRAGYVESTVGRQPALYALDTTQHFAIGIDFEFPPVHLVVTDLSGAVRYQRNWYCDFDMEKKQIIDLMVEGIREAMRQLEITCENVIGVGLGIPGTVNIQRNMSEIISRIPEWNKTPLSEILQSHFDVPIYVRNDAHLLALAAQQMLQTPPDMLYIAYRTGIGMAVVKDGRLFEGVFGNSGYIGHTTVDVNGDLCSCGRRGCLETFASKPTIENKYAQAKHLSRRLNFDDILERAEQGDGIADDILRTAGFYFGVSIANSVKLLDISTVVIDDLKCSREHAFVRAIEEAANSYCSSYAVQPISIIPNPLEEAEYALGGARFVLDSFFKEPQLKLTAQ